ncbi:glutamine synthetase family protein [Aestuariispira ectoiniformans]|uniref:glutamine synthetase family protein n=1 Tax=Aestuariispira ectoiniformans TaxID=2775080 RepID=UPI00223B4FAE|nr:glutamine synthetase [Aestuariispira ectoiniformans]
MDGAQFMNARDVKTVADAKRIVQERGIDYVKVGIFDVDGIMRGKYMSREKFFSALDGGFGFCDVVLGWDSNDQLYDSATYTGWHTAYPDAPVRIIPESCRELPMEENSILFLGEFEEKAETVCPRGVLRRVLDRADKMGLKATAACEFEFFVFDETPESVREKNYKDLENITPGFFGYSMLRNSVHSEFYHDLLNLCTEMDMPIEGLHTETGPGVLEAALAHDDALSAADKASLFKTFTKILCQRQGWMATFMAKWSGEYPGQSGHIHISLANKDGSSAFHDTSKTNNMSDTMRHFIGGQQALMPEILAMVACTVNSYSRLIPGYWAPTEATWSVDNRTTALRAIPGGEKSQRVEYRIAAADINPYIALAAAIGSGLWGIENKIEPTAPVEGNAYEKKFPAKLQLPQTLYEAAGRLRKSKAAQDLFGKDFVEHFAQSREWEEREFRKAITSWEMERYFEII